MGVLVCEVVLASVCVPLCKHVLTVTVTRKCLRWSSLRIWGFHCHGLGSVCGWGTEIWQAVQRGQKKEKEMSLKLFYCFKRIPPAPALSTLGSWPV